MFSSPEVKTQPAAATVGSCREPRTLEWSSKEALEFAKDTDM